MGGKVARTPFQPFWDAENSLKRGVSDTTKKIHSLAETFFIGFAKITKDVGGLGHLLKFSIYSIRMAGFVAGRATMMAPLYGSLTNAKALSDAGNGVFDGMNGIFGKERDKYNVVRKIGNWSTFASAIGSSVDLLEKVSLLNLANLSSSLGKIPLVGGAFASLTLNAFIGATTTMGFASLGIDAAQRLINEDSVQERPKILLELAWCVSEVALGVAVLSGVVTTPGAMVLGIAAGAFGCMSFLNRPSEPAVVTV